MMVKHLKSIKSNRQPKDAKKQQKEKLYGKISDEQKFFILEYLCYLRDHYYRDSSQYKQFQAVIEMIRNIYRNEQNIKENDEK